MTTLIDRITIDPEICHGKPTIRGLRYPVETMLELLSSGMTIDEILADYEGLERADMLAVFAFAARLRSYLKIKPILRHTSCSVGERRLLTRPGGEHGSRNTPQAVCNSYQ